jgi:hypothetical protein
MENMKFELSVDEIATIVKETIVSSVKKSISANEKQVEESMKEYFKKSIFEKKMSQFESSLDWAIERTFREGVEKALIELDFKELVAEKTKEILSDGNFVKKIAEQKVRKALGF